MPIRDTDLVLQVVAGDGVDLQKSVLAKSKEVEIGWSVSRKM
jgi:hypothetical protein